eukprot:1900051-Alexandrium_andersonii.AAC.1
MLQRVLAAHTHARPSARGPPSGEAPGEVSGHLHPNRFPGILPREVLDCSRAPEEVARQSEERSP